MYKAIYHSIDKCLFIFIIFINYSFNNYNHNFYNINIYTIKSIYNIGITQMYYLKQSIS